MYKVLQFFKGFIPDFLKPGNQFAAIEFLASFLNDTNLIYFIYLSTFAFRNLLMISYGSLGCFSGALEWIIRQFWQQIVRVFFHRVWIALVEFMLGWSWKPRSFILYISLLIIILTLSFCFDMSLVLFYWPAALDWEILLIPFII